MRFRGRYSARYNELNHRSIPNGPPRFISANSPIIDLANAELDKVRISCWLSPEGRRWGRYRTKYGQQEAAVMTFQITADQPPGYKLSNFELQLSFENVAPEPGSLISGRGMPTAGSPALCLLILPCPSYVEGPPTMSHRSQVQTVQPEVQFGGVRGTLVGRPVASERDLLRSWVFRSSPISNEAGLLTKAKYVWEASRQNSQVEGRGILYGGVALQHGGKSFLVFCSVCGEACKSGHLFHFSTKQRAAPPRLWQIQPQQSEDDIQNHVEGLEAEMIRLNTAAVARAAAPDQEPTTSQGYGSTIIEGGGTTVHQGDIYYGCNNAQQRHAA